MHELSWKHDYEIGNPFIDHEHQHLFEIALEAFKPVAPEKRKQKIKDIIIELNDYMKVHFEHEEIFMRIVEYPEINEHIFIHKIIIQNMKTMLERLPSMHIKEFEKELAFFIDSSLVSHILDEDSKIHKWYLNKKGQRHIVRWDPDYLIGEEKIDAEHQKLFKIANEAFKIGEQENTNKEEVKKILTNLASYIQEHFQYEEEYMKQINYPQVQKHCDIHQKIIFEMNSLIKEITSTDIMTFEFKLAIFIEKSLVQHIIYEDKKIKHFLKEEDIQIIDIDDV